MNASEIAVADMSPGLLIRLRPAGPWRLGSDSGARDQVGRIYHSDSVFSAVSSAMHRLGTLEDWLDATARNAAGPAVRFSSCFPFQRDALYIVPPRSLWPPAASPKVRWKGARFVPVTLVSDLLAGKPPEENAWLVDGVSECLVPADRKAAPTGPFRASLRSNACVDRQSAAQVEVHSTACLEFAPDSGLWLTAAFADDAAQERWSAPVSAAFRLLADSGFGGERSRGWGRAHQPEITEGTLPGLILAPCELPEAYWLLSLYSPAGDDLIEWNKGAYSLVTRNGRVESPAQWGAPKKALRMVSEGSVLVAPAHPRGAVHDVAPAGFPHPVFRAGFALAIPIPGQVA